MELEELFAADSDKPQRSERRIRLNDNHWQRLDELERKHGIPVAAMIRLAIDCFLPKLSNMNFKEEGIKKLWNDQKF